MHTRDIEAYGGLVHRMPVYATVFIVGLCKRDQRGIDHRDHAERIDHRRKEIAGEREHRQREPQEAVAPHLQEHAGQDHGTGGRLRAFPT